jgi:hypothetical protein
MPHFAILLVVDADDADDAYNSAVRDGRVLAEPDFIGEPWEVKPSPFSEGEDFIFDSVSCCNQHPDA